MQSGYVWGPFWAGAPPAASPLLRLLRILEFKFGRSRSSPEPSRIMGTTFALSLTGKTLAKRILGQGVNLGIAEVAAELCVKAHFPHHD